MIRKSVKRFSEKIMLNQRAEADDDSSQFHRASGANPCKPRLGLIRINDLLCPRVILAK